MMNSRAGLFGVIVAVALLALGGCRAIADYPWARPPEGGVCSLTASQPVTCGRCSSPTSDQIGTCCGF